MKKRYDNIDLLKVIAILMVVSLHTSLWHTNYINTYTISSFVEYCIRLICEGVPIFVMINGFLLLPKKYDSKKHIKKCINIILIIFFWTIIDTLIIELFLNKQVFSFKVFLNQFNKINNTPLWFLQSLLKIYIIFPLLKYIYEDEKKYNYLMLVLLFFVFGLSTLRTINDYFNFNVLNTIIEIINSVNPITNGVFLFYFCLGGYLNKPSIKLEKSKLYKCVIPLGFITWILVILYTSILYKNNKIVFVDNYIYGKISLVFVILMIYKITKKYVNRGKLINRLIQSISTNTMGIYLLHYPITKIILYYFYNNNLNFCIRLLLTIIIFISSYIMSVILKRIPYLKKIITI